MSKERMAKYREFDRDLLDIKDAKTHTAFLQQAILQGYTLDSTGFVPHPGFFQAPHRRDLNGVDIAMVGCPTDLNGLAACRVHVTAPEQSVNGPGITVHLTIPPATVLICNAMS